MTLSGANKRFSKIPKRIHSYVDKNFNDPSSMTTSDDIVKKSLLRIFETKKLNTVCEFLRQLKCKLEKDVKCRDVENLQKVNSVITLFIENDAPKPKQICYEVSIADTLQDISEGILPFSSSTGRPADSCKIASLDIATSSLLSQLQQLCDFSDSEGEVSSVKNSGPKRLDCDRSLLTLLTDLHSVLKATINKVEDTVQKAFGKRRQKALRESSDDDDSTADQKSIQRLSMIMESTEVGSSLGMETESIATAA